MPSEPEESEKNEDYSSNPKVAVVREITQTDHLNKKLLTSYLNSINVKDASEKYTNGVEHEDEEEEEQNWES